MAKLKIEFTEDQIKLIRNLRFNLIEPNFYVTPCHNDITVTPLGKGRYNISNIVKEDNRVYESVSPIVIQNAQDLGDNLYGIDTYNLWGGTYIYEDMAYILGLEDKVLEGTLEDPDGPKYEEEAKQYMDELASFILDNLMNIEEILHQFCTEGIQTGVTYSCKPNEHIWRKETEA